MNRILILLFVLLTGIQALYSQNHIVTKLDRDGILNQDLLYCFDKAHSDELSNSAFNSRRDVKITLEYTRDKLSDHITHSNWSL